MISIHALREEGDDWAKNLGIYQEISIHALREEGDHNILPGRAPVSNFYPRPPRGGRHQLMDMCEQEYKFLSTPSARRATKEDPGKRRLSEISIHALREEGDGRG